jgi:hypothetical protein
MWETLPPVKPVLQIAKRVFRLELENVMYAHLVSFWSVNSARCVLQTAKTVKPMDLENVTYHIAKKVLVLTMYKRHVINVLSSAWRAIGLVLESVTHTNARQATTIVWLPRPACNVALTVSHVTSSVVANVMSVELDFTWMEVTYVRPVEYWTVWPVILVAQCAQHAHLDLPSWMVAVTVPLVHLIVKVVQDSALVTYATLDLTWILTRGPATHRARQTVSAAAVVDQRNATFVAMDSIWLCQLGLV